MRQVFADTFYWIALTDPTDQAHSSALAFNRQNPTVEVFTTETVIIELLNYFSEGGEYWRSRALITANDVLQRNEVRVFPHGDTTLLRALNFYAARMDKGYSLTDCISMLCMREEGIFEVLTADAHFAQEGFMPLLRRD